MKEFVVYTALRLLMFGATFGVVIGVWQVVTGEITSADVFWAVLIGFVVSGIGSYFLLNAQREAFARRVDERASRSMQRIQAKEDVD
ncbi:DUF4229 domain-containing protein [Nocardioides flavescens]|uniref:DUF4229 domain-containing protein n=1 Tax=Nocardioides flavescens TaxID=2691959 RepID=A0A6L7F2V8_9ACTN|nr:DUF4229 domain-containing protein [Nocardioides flavescens]MXG90154.1 DUF4229 domain-containing protein [Nocardioides flavescens]